MGFLYVLFWKQAMQVQNCNVGVYTSKGCICLVSLNFNLSWFGVWMASSSLIYTHNIWLTRLGCTKLYFLSSCKPFNCVEALTLWFSMWTTGHVWDHLNTENFTSASLSHWGIFWFSEVELNCALNWNED